MSIPFFKADNSFFINFKAVVLIKFFPKLKFSVFMVYFAFSEHIVYSQICSNLFFPLEFLVASKISSPLQTQMRLNLLLVISSLFHFFYN